MIELVSTPRRRKATGRSITSSSASSDSWSPRPEFPTRERRASARRTMAISSSATTIASHQLKKHRSLLRSGAALEVLTELLRGSQMLLEVPARCNALGHRTGWTFAAVGQQVCSRPQAPPAPAPRPEDATSDGPCGTCSSGSACPSCWHGSARGGRLPRRRAARQEGLAHLAVPAVPADDGILLQLLLHSIPGRAIDDRLMSGRMAGSLVQDLADIEGIGQHLVDVPTLERARRLCASGSIPMASPWSAARADPPPPSPGACCGTGDRDRTGF